MRTLVPLVSGLFLALGCAPVPPPTEPPSLDGTAWVLASLGTRASGGEPATLRFDAGRAQGSDGCNRYSAPYTSKGAALEVSGQGISTRMACPPEVMETAAAFMAALSGARSYRVQDGRLQLQDAAGTVLASLEAQQQALAGTSWVAVGVNNGKGGVVSIAAAATITLEFSADGKVTGSAGCNRYTGTYSTEGDTVTFGPAAATRKMCLEQAVMEQEQNFLAALGTVRTMRMEGDRLELRTEDGALAISASRATSP